MEFSINVPSSCCTYPPLFPVLQSSPPPRGDARPSAEHLGLDSARTPFAGLSLGAESWLESAGAALSRLPDVVARPTSCAESIPVSPPADTKSAWLHSVSLSGPRTQTLGENALYTLKRIQYPTLQGPHSSCGGFEFCQKLRGCGPAALCSRKAPNRSLSQRDHSLHTRFYTSYDFPSVAAGSLALHPGKLSLTPCSASMLIILIRHELLEANGDRLYINKINMTFRQIFVGVASREGEWVLK